MNQKRQPRVSKKKHHKQRMTEIPQRERTYPRLCEKSSYQKLHCLFQVNNTMKWFELTSPK